MAFTPKQLEAAAKAVKEELRYLDAPAGVLQASWNIAAAALRAEQETAE